MERWGQNKRTILFRRDTRFQREEDHNQNTQGRTHSRCGSHISFLFLSLFFAVNCYVVVFCCHLSSCVCVYGCHWAKLIARRLYALHSRPPLFRPKDFSGKSHWDARSDCCWRCRCSAGCYIAANVRYKRRLLSSHVAMGISCIGCRNTYQLPPLPRLHGHFVFLKFMTPVRVDFLVVVRFARGRAALRIDRNVVAA